MVGLDMPVNINEAVIDAVAGEYRAKCGANDVLMHKMRPVTFEYYLSLRLAADEIRALARKFDGGSVRGEGGIG